MFENNEAGDNCLSIEESFSSFIVVLDRNDELLHCFSGQKHKKKTFSSAHRSSSSD